MISRSSDVIFIMNFYVCITGVTPLHLAVQRGNAAAVRCLLSAGADVNLVDTKFGHTALHYAIQRSDVMTAELLRCSGASLTHVTSSPQVYSTKCSTAMLQRNPVNFSYLPTCCPTGNLIDTGVCV